PRADVASTLAAAQHVTPGVDRDAHQPPARILELTWSGLTGANERLLHDIVAVRRRSGTAIRQSPEQRPMRLEPASQNRVRWCHHAYRMRDVRATARAALIPLATDGSANCPVGPTQSPARNTFFKPATRPVRRPAYPPDSIATSAWLTTTV